ncbi:ABC transporter ATP-binding protein [Halodesulfurarchaeum sp.]|uniref:ABC transporter ATP-binding protein n=1 Tax=Halodesulfurarchaeum sp. TaxID=1980530 RepID=UPI001BBB0D4B|nr:ABC transporter ATP-binding protein [Halodesulfurarchaeum sp.]
MGTNHRSQADGTSPTVRPQTGSAATAYTPVLSLESVTTTFEDEAAIGNFTLSVQDGELLTILGPSGCGKTTALRTIAGLERPDSGRVRINGRTVADEETFRQPEDRDVGLVFQDFALFSHMTVAENVGFGIESWSEAKRTARVDELLTLVGLAGAGERSPSDLSGGQQQRVALARALAPEPEVLLLDEPFSSLDRDLRERMREEVRRILQAAGVTTVFVTHDQTEALSISDRVAVMCEGHLEQVGHPETVFAGPESRFVAEFLGNPTFLDGQVGEDAVSTHIGPITLDQLPGLSADESGNHVAVVVRPDDIEAVAVPASEADGIVRRRSYEGSTIRYRIELDDGTTLEAMHNHTAAVDLDDPVAVGLVADHEFAWFDDEAETDGC